MPSGIAILWLPNALLLAFFLIKDKKEWKFYIPFLIIAEIIADYGSFTLIQALQFSLVNLFETIVAAFLIKKFVGKEKLNFISTKYVLAFIFIGVNIMPAIGAIFGATVYYTQISTQSNIFEFWRLWFFGNAVGILVLAPLTVMLIENYKSLKTHIFNLQNISILVFGTYLAFEVFSRNDINFFLPTTPLIFILILLWIVYKQGILPSLLFAFLITIIAIINTTNGTGPFSMFAEKETTIYLQEYIALLFIIVLFFGVLLKEIKDSNKKLEVLNKTLERKVKEKTKSLLQANEKLKNLAAKDSLTNIYNRRILEEFITKESFQAKRHKYSLSAIMIDIDHFKDVNDTYGHQVGDEVIIKISEIISLNIRKSDIFGRWGGEEFIIILPKTNIEEAFIVAENIRKKVEIHDFDKVGKKTISLGISEFDFDEDALEFVKNADAAMYEAKNNGRNKSYKSGKSTFN